MLTDIADLVVHAVHCRAGSGVCNPCEGAALWGGPPLGLLYREPKHHGWGHDSQHDAGAW